MWFHAIDVGALARRCAQEAVGLERGCAFNAVSSGDHLIDRMKGQARGRVLGRYVGVLVIEVDAMGLRFHFRESAVDGPALCAVVGNVTQQVGVVIRGLGGGVVSYVNGERIFDGCFVRSLVLALFKQNI